MIEQQILSGILYNEDFARKALPFLKDDYFRDASQRAVLQLIQDYIDKYNKLPSISALAIDLSNLTTLNQKEFDTAANILKEISEEKGLEVDAEWLSDKTEEFCQDRAIVNAIMDSMKIIESKDNTQTRGAIPKLLQDALGVSFDNAIGHDYINDADARFAFYHHSEEKIPFDLEYLNKITRGGLARKTLNVIIAGTGVGKTLAMCHFAATHLMAGKNVLYITLEMAEEKISQRIDCNLMNVTVDELEELPKADFDRKFSRLKEKATGRLVVKEFPTSAAGAAHFRHLLNELRLKQNFIPDIIYIDYINICSSSRLKLGNAVNSYTYIKAIAEELRGLAIEFNVPIMSATQTNRGGQTSSDIDLTDTSESHGLPMTVDLFIAMMITDELADLNQILFKQLKNRYADMFINERFVVGVERSKFRLYDVESIAQKDLRKISQTQRSSSHASEVAPLNRYSSISIKEKPNTDGFKFD